MKYTVTVEIPEEYYPLREAVFENEKDAVDQAEKWAEEHSDKQVFVKFERGSDGTTGYINRDGADVTGKNWVE